MYKKRGRKNKVPNKAEFYLRYYNLDLSAEELATYYKVKPHTIYNWALKFRKEDEEEEKKQHPHSSKLTVKK